MTEGARYDRIQAEMERMIANAPGADRGEKLSWCWKNTKFGVLYNAMTAIRALEDPMPKPFDPSVIRYYIRFADRPPEAGHRSRIWHGSTAVGTEKGISAYSVEWDKKRELWKLDPGDNTGPEDTLYRIARGEESKRKIWLLSGPETGDTGSDTEPLLNGADVTVVKQLSPLELFIPGYYDPADLDPAEINRIAKTPFFRGQTSSS